MTDKLFNIDMPITGYEIRRSAPPWSNIEEDWIVAEGIATDAAEDQLEGQMSPECVIGLIDCVNTKIYRSKSEAEAVRVDIEHSDHPFDEVGFVRNARAIYELTPDQISRGMKPPLMQVELWLDPEMSHGKDLKRALDKGRKLGLSIYGAVQKVKRATSSITGRPIELFEKVDLRKIAITQKPANKNTWVAEVRRSMIGAEIEVEDEVVTPSEVTEEPGASTGEGQEHAAQETVETPAEVTEEVIVVTIEESEEAPAEKPIEAVPDAPAESEEIATEPNEETVVARSEEYNVYRSYVDNQIGTVLEMIKPLPDIVERALSQIDQLKATLAERDTTIASLATRLDALSNMSAGRKGNVARSMTEEAAAEEGPLGSELSRDDRRALIAELVSQNRREEAMALVAGILPSTPKINDPLLPQK